MKIQQTLRFALFGNEYQTGKHASTKRMLTCLQEHHAEISIEKVFYTFLRETGQISQEQSTGLNVFEEGNFTADFAISMGGDGTFLKAASYVATKETPIVGVNMGRLGFLSDVSASEISQSVDAIYAGKYSIEKHAVIEAKVNRAVTGGFCPYALNDIAILKRDNASMITIHAKVDEQPLATYQADGLIVSTPTGSTAYNLSNGGPIMVPLTSILCLTPVAPHSLSIRPVVIPDNSTIDITVQSRTGNFLVAIDGRSFTLDQTTTVQISRARHCVNIVKSPSRSYFATLREKMMWGADIR